MTKKYQIFQLEKITSVAGHDEPTVNLKPVGSALSGKLTIENFDSYEEAEKRIEELQKPWDNLVHTILQVYSV